jgi:hypothetical protein
MLGSISRKLCESTGENPVIQIALGKNKHWVGIHRETDGEEGRRKAGKGPLRRKQANAAIHGAKIRWWRKRESHGDASQMSFAPNGAKGYTTATKWDAECKSHFNC